MSDLSGTSPPGLVSASPSSSGADSGLQGGQPSPVDSSSSKEDGGRKGSKDPDGKGKYKGGRISDGKSKDAYNPQGPDGNDTVRGKGQGKSKDKTRARGGGERNSDGPLARGERESDAPLAVGGCGGGGRTRARVKAPPVGLAPPCPGSHPTVKAPPPMGPPRKGPAAEPGVVVPPPAPPGVADPGDVLTHD